MNVFVELREFQRKVLEGRMWWNVDGKEEARGRGKRERHGEKKREGEKKKINERKGEGGNGETEKEGYWTFSTEWSLKKRQSHIRDAHLPRWNVRSRNCSCNLRGKKSVRDVLVTTTTIMPLCECIQRELTKRQNFKSRF